MKINRALLKGRIHHTEESLAASAEAVAAAESTLIRLASEHQAAFVELTRLEATHSTLRERLADQLNELGQA